MRFRRFSNFCSKFLCFLRPKHPSSSPSSACQSQQALPQHKIESQSHDDEPSAFTSSSFHGQAQQIAAAPVSGMRRTAGPGNAGYITSYQATQGLGLASGGRAGPTGIIQGGSHEYSPSMTLVGDEADMEKKGGSTYGGGAKTSTWQGKPNGTAYDKRTELTEEDEDMWARMAM